MKSAELTVVAGLLRRQRQAALGTLQDGAPFVSMVAFAAAPGLDGFLLHLSGLSPHTRHLQADPRASLLVAEPERPDVEDVQTLPRITLVGTVALVPKDGADYAAGRDLYLARLPAAAMLFDFPDFNLYRFIPTEARYVGGFARAYTLRVEDLRQAAQL